MKKHRDKLDLLMNDLGEVDSKVSIGWLVVAVVHALAAINETLNELLQSVEIVSKPATETPIKKLGLSQRLYRVLKRGGINTVEELLESIDMDEVNFIYGFGDKSNEELICVLVKKGYINIEEK